MSNFDKTKKGDLDWSSALYGANSASDLQRNSHRAGVLAAIQGFYGSKWQQKHKKRAVDRNMSFEQTFSVAFMPDGRPAPAVLTAEETISLLRLDTSKGERTLKYWRDQGELVGIRIGRRVRYPLDEVMRFLAQKVEKGRSNG